MNSAAKYVLTFLHRVYRKLFIPPRNPMMNCTVNPDVSSEKIRNLLDADKPCLVCHYGSNELNCVLNYLSVKKGGGFSCVGLYRK